ncbi:MAG: FMN-binding protein [Gammaproteobacteria bacterium]|nr:FMN-binding protein [Gammaproteobacteria bacterium]
MKKHLITGLTLALFALICGGLLAFINMFTSPMIKAREEKKIEESISIVFDAYKSGDYTKEEFNREGVVLGYYIINNQTNEKEAVIYIIESQGYASKIRMMIGVNKDNKITGYTVISQAETKGDITAHDFNMNGKSNLDEFDSLAGSTYSSKAVKKNFSLALSYAKVDLGGNAND